MAQLTEKQYSKIEEGKWIHATITIEVQGNDKKYVKKALEDLVGKLKKERGVEIVEEKYSEISEIRDNFYSYSVDLDFLAHDFGIMTRIALLYSPSYVEIFEPKKEVKIPIGEAQNLLVDIAHIVTSLSHAVFIQRGKLKQLEQKEAEK